MRLYSRLRFNLEALVPFLLQIGLQEIAAHAGLAIASQNFLFALLLIKHFRFERLYLLDDASFGFQLILRCCRFFALLNDALAQICEFSVCHCESLLCFSAKAAADFRWS